MGNIPKNRDRDELLEEFTKHARKGLRGEGGRGLVLWQFLKIESSIAILSTSSWNEDLWIGKDSLSIPIPVQITDKLVKTAEESESQFLRVIARNSQTFCRRPDSDSNETRSRRSSGPKTKLETPLSTIRAHIWCPGASKVADFGRPKKPFFGQIFFLSNRTKMFAVPFSQVFSQ